MEAQMSSFAVGFEDAGKRTEFPHGAERAVDVYGKPVTLVTFEPGWRWSNDLKPIVGTQHCPLLHTGYMLAGRLHVEPPDGPWFEISPGELFVIEPGHDAWVVGEDQVTFLDWGGKAREIPGGAR
jgi:quercetin dioxygenase-like cupin family protein